MRIVALTLVILCTSLALLANDRQWKDATVTNITSDVGGAVVAPIGTMLVGAQIVRTYYWIQTDEATYVIGPVIGRHKELDITLHEKTKITIDGRNAHILDDGGKDRKLPIAEKIARTDHPASTQ